MFMEEADPGVSRGLKRLELDSGITQMLLTGIYQRGARKGKSTEVHQRCNVPCNILIPFFSHCIYASLSREGESGLP